MAKIRIDFFSELVSHIGFIKLNDFSIVGEHPGAKLKGMQLGGADLTGAELADSDLSAAILDEMTCLPDGAYWSADADLARFTDRSHSDFWAYTTPMDCWAGGVVESQRAETFSRYEREIAQGPAR